MLAAFFLVCPSFYYRIGWSENRVALFGPMRDVLTTSALFPKCLP